MSIYFVLALVIFNGTAVNAACVVLPLYALSLGAQPLTVGVLAASFSVFPMVLAVTSGRLNDRFGARWLLLFGTTANGVGMAVPYFFHNLPAIFIGGAMCGVSMVSFNLSTQNVVGLLSTADTRAKNFGNYSLAASTGELLAPLLGGFSIDHSGYAVTCLQLGLLALVPFAMLVVRGNALPGGTRTATRGGGGVLSMLTAPGVPRLLATGSLMNAGINLYRFYMPVYGHAIGLSASLIGSVLAMYSVAAFVVRAVLARLVARYQEERLLAFAFFMGALSLALVPFFKGAVILGVLSFIFGLGMGCGQPIVTMLMFVSSTDGRSGEALGLKVTVNHLTKMVSPIVFGAIASAFGLPPMFWINALMLGTGGMLSRPKKNA